jgi:hypothetical protein
MPNTVEKHQPWTEISERKPRREGWYAVQDSTVEGEWFIDAYWMAGSWWKFGKIANVMNVRTEVHGVLRWRFQDRVGRADIMSVAKTAIVPRAVESKKLQRAFARRVWLMHVIATNRYDQKTLTDKLGWPRKSVAQLLDGLATFGIITGVNDHGILCILDWGPINQQWLMDNHKLVEAATI